MQNWCCLSDSNRPPSGYKADALPDELKQHGGDGGNRAPDHLRMKEVLYQLSYITLVRATGLEPATSTLATSRSTN
jgi:hypothetical protein